MTQIIKTKFGYARISTSDQNLSLQIEALEKEGCDKIFNDTISGNKFICPGLSELLKYTRKGDSMVIYKLDRLGRSLIDIIKLISSFEEKGIELISLTDRIDTKTSMGKAMYKITATFAELERDLIRERTKAGLQSAKARGKVGGRKFLLTEEQQENLKMVHATNKVSIQEICKMFGIKKPTIYKYLRR